MGLTQFLPRFPSQIWVSRRVLGLCTRVCNICCHIRPRMSAIYVTNKILFERLYLVLGMGTFEP